MTTAAAFFVGLGVGASLTLALLLLSFWRLRNGPRAFSRSARVVLLVATLAVPIVVAISMPDFKTAFVAWLGVPIGMVLARALTMPLAFLGARRLESRWQGRHR